MVVEEREGEIKNISESFLKFTLSLDESLKMRLGKAKLKAVLLDPSEKKNPSEKEEAQIKYK